MSNYYYKNIPISTITNITGSTSNAPGFSQFPVVNTIYNKLNPLPFGYTYTTGNTQTEVSSLCTASSTIYSASTSITVPSGVNSIRVISIGGGGGGGGYGGDGNMNAGAYGNKTGHGGSGGQGGFGSYQYDEVSSISGQIINISVGNGGAGGQNGSSNNAVVNNFLTDLGTTGNNGAAGNSGTSSFIQIGNTTYALSSAGNGGNGGGGGNAYYNPNNGLNTSNGGNGISGNNSGDQGNIDTNYPPLTNYGIGGGQSEAGTGGAVQIIWLYD